MLKLLNVAVLIPTFLAPVIPGLVIFPDPNPASPSVVREYLQKLISKNLISPNFIENQGIWIQSGPMLMVNYKGDIPLPAASLTKVATSLVAVKTWGAKHQFETLVSTNGQITDGVLEGDLIITGGSDPLFIRNDAIALGKTLNQIGIKQVRGDLIITGKFALDGEREFLLAGKKLKSALNKNISIAGLVKLKDKPISQQTVLIRHRSLPLYQLLKVMNIYSNNDIAEILTESVGGVNVVQSTAARLAGVPESEIQLINGSGLGSQNKISAKAICAMFMALQLEANIHNLNLSNLFLTSGLDHQGTIRGRNIPYATVFKTGTLDQVSTLAGVMATRDRGLVWFAILNQGASPSNFRTEQDKLLQRLSQKFKGGSSIPDALKPQPVDSTSYLGRQNRNEIPFNKQRCL